MHFDAPKSLNTADGLMRMCDEKSEAQYACFLLTADYNAEQIFQEHECIHYWVSFELLKPYMMAIWP